MSYVSLTYFLQFSNNTYSLLIFGGGDEERFLLTSFGETGIVLNFPRDFLVRTLSQRTVKAGRQEVKTTSYIMLLQ